MTTIGRFVVMGRFVADVSFVCCLGCVARMRFCRFSFAVTPVCVLLLFVALHVYTVCLATLRSAQGVDQPPRAGEVLGFARYLWCSRTIGLLLASLLLWASGLLHIRRCTILCWDQ